VSIFTKRNALVGFVTLKALERRKQRRNRHALKLVALVVLGLVSAGVLAAIVAVALRRQRDAGELPDEQRLEGYITGDDDGTGIPEPSFAA
jgi:hypothetical protein